MREEVREIKSGSRMEKEKKEDEEEVMSADGVFSKRLVCYVTADCLKREPGVT